MFLRLIYIYLFLISFTILLYNFTYIIIQIQATVMKDAMLLKLIKNVITLCFLLLMFWVNFEIKLLNKWALNITTDHTSNIVSIIIIVKPVSAISTWRERAKCVTSVFRGIGHNLKYFTALVTTWWHCRGPLIYLFYLLLALAPLPSVG